MTVFLDHPKSPAALHVMEPEHAPLLLRLQNEPGTRRFLRRHEPIAQAEELEWIKHTSQSRSNFAFVVFDKRNNQAVGSMGLHTVDWKNRQATTGAALLEQFCNRGIGTAAKMLLLEWAFNELGLHRIESLVYSFNERSIAYSKKCGYRIVGRRKESHFLEGVWYDQVILEVHAKDWRQRWQKYRKSLERRSI